MNQILDFITTNFQLVLSVVFLFVSLLVFILRKKPITDIYSVIYELAILAIKDSEFFSNIDPDFKGEKKLNSAITRVCSALKLKYPNLVIEKYVCLIEKVIESILSTPQKKNK